MAPEPLVPVVSTPLKLMTVIDAAALWEIVAVIVALAIVDGANARQISDVPRWVLVRRTSTHVTPPPVMPVTVWPVALASSAATNARSSSFPAVVDSAGDTRLVLLVDRSTNTVASIVGATTCAAVKFAV